MIQFGYSAGFASFSNYASQSVQNLPQAGAQSAQVPTQNAQVPAHTTTNPTMSSPISGAMAMPMYPVAMMSPAYMMAYPQMSSPMGMQGSMQGMNAATMPGATAASGGGHVTANPTNSMASSAMSGMGGGFGMDAMSGMGGYGGFGGVGMYGAFVMPVIMMSPVFFQMGYPVFQGSQAQPPLSSEEPSSEGVQDDVPAAAEVEAPAANLGEPVTAAPVNTEGVVIDVVPTAKEGSSQTLPTLPITELGAEDFAKYRLIEKSKQQETALSLTLTTQDGDTISLDFKQLDSMQMSRFHGHTLEGEKVKDMSMTEETDRVVNMDVVGDLSDDEKAAVDKVLSTIIEVVNKFFSGDIGQAVDKLKQMDFDGQQLAELSLNMSMSKSAGVSKAYHNGAEHLHELKNRDADIGQALDFLASEQKRLIDVAKEIFDAPSAAKLVRSLVAPLLSDPFSQLSEQISAANELNPADAAETDDLVSEQDSSVSEQDQKSEQQAGDDD